MGEHRKQIPADKLKDYTAYPALIVQAECQHTLDIIAAAQCRQLKDFPLQEDQLELGREIAKAWLGVLTETGADKWANPATALKTAFNGLNRLVRSEPDLMDKPTTEALRLFAAHPPRALVPNQTFANFCNFVSLEGTVAGCGARVKDRKTIDAIQLPQAVSIFDVGRLSGAVPDNWQDPYVGEKAVTAPAERYGYRGVSGAGSGKPHQQLYRLLASV
jgi:hypothetical protein